MSTLPPGSLPAAAPRVRGSALWHLAVAQPHLLATHLAGYASLVRSEAAFSAAVLQRRALLMATCLGCLCVAATLLGGAIMLWAAAPAGTLAQAWVLALVPLLPALGAAWALHALRHADSAPMWSMLQAQIAADAALLDSRAP